MLGTGKVLGWGRAGLRELIMGIQYARGTHEKGGPGAGSERAMWVFCRSPGIPVLAFNPHPSPTSRIPPPPRFLATQGKCRSLHYYKDG